MTDAEKRVRYDMARDEYRKWWRAVCRRLKTSLLNGDEMRAVNAQQRLLWKAVYRAGYPLGLRAKQIKRELFT